MPAVPLSSAEMLEQEYEYFHGPLGDLEWKFVASDLRDVPQLLARLAGGLRRLPARREEL
jgi:hypothetical protein